ncbi:MAG: cell wall hydrolase [Clostridiaceae bacterium]|jgi:N-acetylmuramoyl-L-alanine amidase|nr:cell wall hydrolase [Clostridiaceae bacterium]
MKKNLKSIICITIISLLLMGQTIGVFGDTYYGLLKFGSRGAAVVQLQQALKNKGFSPGSADGIYGKLTENAVIKFQQANKLRIDGIAGRETQSKLFDNAVASRGTSYTTTDLYWLSRIIHAEAEAESYTGKVAVGNVILNRVKSSSFPNTVKGVIFEYYKGIPQFSPVADGTIYNTPNSDSIKAAKAAFSGTSYVGNATYFFNPDKSEGAWIIKNKTYVKRIGNHVFYK